MSTKNNAFLKHPSTWAFLLLFIPLCIYYLWGVQYIPFHGDEGHLLYQSQDFDLLFTDPFNIVWEKGTPVDNYRAIVAPLPKYVLGLGRSLAGYPASFVSINWDWTVDMQTNIARGALPPEGLFRAARSASAIAVLIGIVFIYLAGNQLKGPLTGWLAAFLVGSNALVLLHGRRAMSEGTLVFAVCFAIWGMFQARKSPWLAGLSLAFAVNSKHSVIVLIPVSFLAVLWPGESEHFEFKSALSKMGQFLGLFLFITYLLNPMIWRYPFQAIPKMVRERAEWVEAQISTLRAIGREDQIIDTLPEKILVTSANLFIRPISFYEIGNYADDTAASEAIYSQIPGHNFLRDMISGGILFILTLVGLVVGGIQAFKEKFKTNRNLLILLLTTIILGGALIWAVFLPPQRYVIPLVPISSLWIAFLIGDVAEKVEQELKLRQPSLPNQTS